MVAWHRGKTRTGGARNIIRIPVSGASDADALAIGLLVNVTINTIR